MLKEKILQVLGTVRELSRQGIEPSGKIDILNKSQGKLK